MIISQLLYYKSVKILFSFDKNKSKKEETADKNSKNSKNSLNKIFTISIKSKNDKSDDQMTCINFNQTIQIANKNINDRSEDNDNDNIDIKTKKIHKNYKSNKGKNYNSDNKDNESEDIKKKSFKNSNDRNNNDIISNQDEIDIPGFKDNDNDNDNIKKKSSQNSKNIKINNYISNQDTINNLDYKDNDNKDIKRKISKNSNNRHNNDTLIEDNIDNSDNKDNNNESNNIENNNSITSNKKTDFSYYDKNKKLYKSAIFSSRNVFNNPDEKSDRSEKDAIYEYNDTGDDFFKGNHIDSKEKSENYKFNGICDDIFKTNHIDSKEKYSKIKYILASINSKQELLKIYITIIIFILSIHNLFFYNAFLFSDKTISKRYYLKNKQDIKYLLTKEYDRILLVFFICKVINAIFISLLEYSEEKLNLANIIENEINYKNENEIFIIDQKEIKNENIVQIRIKNSNENESEKIIDLIKTYRLGMTIFHFLIILINLIYLYFFMVFGNANPNIQLSLLWSSLTSFVIYIIFNIFVYLIKFSIKERIIKEDNYFLKCLYKLKNII